MDLDSEASHSEDALSLTEVPLSFKEYNDVEVNSQTLIIILFFNTEYKKYLYVGFVAYYHTSCNSSLLKHFLV